MAGERLFGVPNPVLAPLPVARVLLAALFWAFTYIQLRHVDGSTSVMVQMLITNGVIMLSSAVTLPWTYSVSSAPAVLGRVGTALVGGIGQYLLFASFTRATATLLAPFEYTGLIWAFLLSSLVWGTMLDRPLMVSAGLIAISGTLAMVFGRNVSPVVVDAEGAAP